MKVAVTAKSPELDSEVDPRFGRAAYIMVVESEDMSFEVIDNEKNKKAFQGAGIQAASSVSEKGAEVLLTGYCGPKAFQVVDAAGIKVVNDVTGVVKEAVENLVAGKYTFSTEANVDAHW
mgnify:CR=1 FL=1